MWWHCFPLCIYFRKGFLNCSITGKGNFFFSSQILSCIGLKRTAKKYLCLVWQVIQTDHRLTTWHYNLNAYTECCILWIKRRVFKSIPCSHRKDVYSCSNYRITGHLKKLCDTFWCSQYIPPQLWATLPLLLNPSPHIYLLASLFLFGLIGKWKRKQGISLGEQTELSSQLLSQHLQQLSCSWC